MRLGVAILFASIVNDRGVHGTGRHRRKLDFLLGRGRKTRPDGPSKANFIQSSAYSPARRSTTDKTMKILRLISVTCAIATLTVVTVNGQYESSTTTTTYIPTTTVVGSRVTGPQGEEIGQISDVVLDRQTGCMAYVVLSTEQNGTRKTVAAPWAVFSPGSDTRTYTVRVDRQRIYSAPVWESSRIDEYSRTDWVNNVYSYYGVQPQVGVNVQANFGNRTDEQRAREQMNAPRRERAGQTPNPDTLTQPPRNPNRRGGDANAAGENMATSEVSPSEQRGARGHRTRPGASPAAPGGASATPAGSAAERPSRRESNPGQEAGATATPESNRAEHRAQREHGTERPAEAGTSASPNPAGAGETPPRPHHGGRTRGAQPSPQASPTP